MSSCCPPNQTTKKISTLYGTSTPLAKEVTQATDKKVDAPTPMFGRNNLFGGSQNVHALLRDGYRAADGLAGWIPPEEAGAFNLPASREVDPATLGRVIEDWSKNIHALRACADKAHDNSDLTDEQLRTRKLALSTLEGVVESGFKPLKQTLDRNACQISVLVLDI